MKNLFNFLSLILVFALNANTAFAATKEVKKEKSVKTIIVKGRIDIDMYGNVFGMNGANVQLHNDKLGSFPKSGSFITGKDGRYVIEVPANSNYNLYVNNRFVTTTQTLAENTALQPYIGDRHQMQKVISYGKKRVAIYATPRATN